MKSTKGKPGQTVAHASLPVPAAARGRPRSFDTGRALEAAMKIFWEKGYEGTSLDDLTGAMNINRPSLYAAFGNKESLFRLAVDRYTNESLCHWGYALAAPTAREVADRLLRTTVKLLSDPKHPRGCLLVQGALTCGSEGNALRKELAERRSKGVDLLHERFKRAKRERDLPKSSNPAALARFLATVTHGLSIQAAGGATRAELTGVIETALGAFP